MNKEHLIELILSDSSISFILDVIEQYDKQELYLCAGTIRNFVWNYISNIPNHCNSDIDIVYYDDNSSYEDALVIEQQLLAQYPNLKWEVRNQAHMHHHNHIISPYTSLSDAIAHFPEQCTAIALRRKQGVTELIVPYGIDDIINMVVQPTPYFKTSELFPIYYNRITTKNWKHSWPSLTIIEKI